MTRITVMVSGGGTNLQALLDAQARGELGSGEIVLVLSSNAKAYALERAARAGVAGVTVARRDYPDEGAFEQALLDVMAEYRVDLIVMAGYMSVIGERFVRTYDRRILNVHPSLIPSFCGRGMYGLHVHEAALAYGVKVTGATVHFVNEIVDGGEIVLQKAVAVQPGDSPETLQRRVMEQAEWLLLPQAVRMFCAGELK